MAALLSDDPVAAVRAAADDAGLSPQERDWLRSLSPDGVAMTALVLKKLRFERLPDGDRDTAEQFARAPAAFMALFRAYTAATPPEQYFPDAEARQFRKWKGA